MLVLPNTAKAANFEDEDLSKIEYTLMAENVLEEKTNLKKQESCHNIIREFGQLELRIQICNQDIGQI